jgi:prevent-host-death family protein
MDTKTKSATITASQLQRQVGTVLRRVGQQKQHLLIERDGFPVAVIIPVVDYEIFKQILSRKNRSQ